MQARHEKEKKDQSNKFEDQNKDQQEKILQLSEQNSQLQDAKRDLETLSKEQ